MPHIPSTHPWIFRPIRGEKFRSRYSGHLSSRLAEIGHNMTKQRGFPYTWKKVKLKAVQSVFIHLFWTFSFCFLSYTWKEVKLKPVQSVFIHLFWTFPFCLLSLDATCQYSVGLDWFLVWTRSPPYGWTLLASSWSERFPKVEVSSLYNWNPS
jgi:hypothetical protein